MSYTCKAGCCHVRIYKTETRGNPWRIELNGEGCSIQSLAERHGVFESTIRKRLELASCLQKSRKAPPPRREAGAAKPVTQGASDTPAGRFARLPRIAL